MWDAGFAGRIDRIRPADTTWAKQATLNPIPIGSDKAIRNLVFSYWRMLPAEAARAHELVERAAVRGKIVLMVNKPA